MKRYIILNEGHPPFLTDYYDPENHEPETRPDGFAPVQIVVDLSTMKHRVNQGERAGEWIDMEEDHL